MKAIIFAIVFPLIYITFTSFVKKAQQKTEIVGDVFFIRYPKFVGVIGLIDTAIFLCIFIVAAIDLSKAYFVLLIPLAGVWLGAALMLIGFVWQVKVEGDSLSVHGFLGNFYQIQMGEIVSVKRECKDNSNTERLIIRTETRKLVVESGASGYFLLKDKLQNELNCRALWGF